jgi:adenine-specific DNA-methyltransferase
LNEAFHISTETKSKIINNDPKSDNLIFELLRGRDIKRYKYEFNNLHLIFTQRGNVNIDEFEGIKTYLENFKAELTPRASKSDKTGRKPGNYKWYEIQDNTSYYKEFSKEKIIWLEISDKANFTYDYSGKYLTNSAYFITGHSLKYLLAVLNSKLCDFYFFQKTAVIAGGRKRYTKQYVEQNPIPVISEQDQKPFIELVNHILEQKELDPSTDTTTLESQIDQLVYKLYDLTEEEIKIVEGV